jgi:hypothetical protein
MALSPVDAFASLPTRLLLDTCILDKLYEQGAYVWEGELPEGVGEDEVDPELVALRAIFLVNERAGFGVVVSPLTFAELANVQDFSGREGRVRWALDVLDHWLIMLEETGDRVSQGGYHLALSRVPRLSGHSRRATITVLGIVGTLGGSMALKYTGEGSVIG